MEIVEVIGIAVFVVLAVLCLLFLRRGFIARRGGTIELSLRLSTMVPGRGWSSGLARFAGDELRWYRIFSFAVRPPAGEERLVLPSNWVVVRCVSHQAPVEIAMAATTLTGFLSWVEGAPPGGAASERPRRSWAS